MRTTPPFLLRPERLIAAGRVTLASFSLFAVWLDPTEPARFANLAYGLLIGYVVYAMLVALYAWRVETLARSWPTISQIIDLAFFSLFIFFTSGPGSPFNVYFVFAVICATIRWQAKGAFAVAAIALAIFTAFGVYFGTWSNDALFDDRAFVIRGTYLLVTAILLGYIGIHEQRLLRDMWLMTSWPPSAFEDLESLTQRLLGHAGTVLGAQNLTLIWSYVDEPAIYVARIRHGKREFEIFKGKWPLVAGELDEMAFLSSNPGSGQVLIQTAEQSFRSWNGQILQRHSRDLLGQPKNMLWVPTTGTRVSVRLMVWNKPDLSRDDLVLAGIVCAVVSSRLDAAYLHHELRRGAAVEERIRLARDLHDGVLQSFTGIALRLAAIRAMLANHEPGALHDVEELQSILAAEQRELRFFIKDLKPAELVNQRVPLSRRLKDLADRVEHEWDIRVVLKIDVPADLPDPFCREVYHVVREALVNAARHGAASTCTVTVLGHADAGIAVSIVDDGRGFAFTGTYSTEELAQRDLGPKTLRERVQSMRGSLTLESGPAGAALHIVLPLVA